ncbi:hypothetical protein BDY24DRAFT_375936 [Mrakia frigida]|uniref:uncharacterized protein n=1 Tax=Mrakia frigida TaxID=29902 RepID=UPI003FCC13BE
MISNIFKNTRASKKVATNERRKEEGGGAGGARGEEQEGKGKGATGGGKRAGGSKRVIKKLGEKLERVFGRKKEKKEGKKVRSLSTRLVVLLHPLLFFSSSPSLPVSISASALVGFPHYSQLSGLLLNEADSRSLPSSSRQLSPSPSAFSPSSSPRRSRPSRPRSRYRSISSRSSRSPSKAPPNSPWMRDATSSRRFPRSTTIWRRT